MPDKQDKQEPRRQDRPRGEFTTAVTLAAGSLAEIATAALLAAGARRQQRGRARGATLAVIAVTGVNVVAFLGQLAYWKAHVASLAEQVLIAAVLESIAIYWASQAHRARMADDSSFRPALASYLFAAGVGALNYSHYMLPGWRPTVLAVTFGGMSAISPWLWASYSRRVNRDELKARGDIEDHAVRLGATRWAWHAWRCVIVMWKATWPGITRPAEAIALHVPRRERKRAEAVRAAPETIRKIAETARKPAAKPAETSGRPEDPQAPPPVPDPVTREPRMRAARAPGLAAARDELEAQLARELAATARPWPSDRALAASDERYGGSRRKAERVLAIAGTLTNGAVHGEHRA